MIEIENSFPKIAIITPGYKPVPDICGGAVEHLITHIILENEKTPRYQFVLYTVNNIKLQEFNFKYTNILQIKNWRKNIIKRIISYFINFIFRKTKSNYRFNYFAKDILLNFPNDIQGIIMENDLDILRALKPKLPTKLPIVYHMHNDYDTYGEAQKTRDAMKWTVKNVNEIWTVSKYISNHIKSLYPEANTKVLLNAIDRKRFSAKIDNKSLTSFFERNKLSKDDFVILYSGRIIPQKGVLELIKACILLPEELNFKLIIAGDILSAPSDYKKELFIYAKKLNSKIIFTGLIPHYEMQVAYDVASIVAIPSIWQEAFCLTALEASCHGKACVASISGGMTEVLDNSCAQLVELGNDYEKRFSNALYKLIIDNMLRKKMEQNAIIKSQNFPDEKEYFVEFQYLLNNILTQKGDEL